MGLGSWYGVQNTSRESTLIQSNCHVDILDDCGKIDFWSFGIFAIFGYFYCILKVKRWFSPGWPNFNMTYVCEFSSFSNGLLCKRHLLFMKNSLGNIWSTFRQHMLPKYCLKDHSKKSFLRIFWRNNTFKTTFRQQVLPKCYPNVNFRNFCKMWMSFTPKTNQLS